MAVLRLTVHPAYRRIEFSRVVPLRPVENASGLNMCLGAVTAAYMIVGRWTPARLSATPESWQLPELRTLLLVVLAAGLCIRPEPDLNAAGSDTELTPVRWIVVSIAYLMLSVTWSASPEEGLKKLGECAPMLLAIVLSLKLFRGDSRGDAKNAFWATFAVFGVALGAVALAAGVNTGSRVSVLGGGPNVFGRNMGLAFLAAMFLSVRLRIRSALILAAVSPLLVILSGSRGALAGLLASVLVLLYYLGARIRTLLPVAAVGVILTGLILYSPLGSIARRIYNNRIEKLTFWEHHTSGRDSLYVEAIDLGVQHPWFGAGLGAFSGIYGDYPHNLVLESFAEGGVVAAGLLVIGFTISCGRFIRSRDIYDEFSVAAFTLFLVTSQFSGDLFDSRGVFLFLALAISRPAKKHVSHADWVVGGPGESDLQPVTFPEPTQNFVRRVAIASCGRRRTSRRR